MNWAPSKPREFAERRYRCHVCMDVGWVEVDASGRGTVKRCHGPRGEVCPYDRHRAEEARKKAASSGKPTRGDEAAV